MVMILNVSAKGFAFFVVNALETAKTIANTANKLIDNFFIINLLMVLKMPTLLFRFSAYPVLTATA
jgi:hypothetical protein